MLVAVKAGTHLPHQVHIDHCKMYRAHLLLVVTVNCILQQTTHLSTTASHCLIYSSQILQSPLWGHITTDHLPQFHHPNLWQLSIKNDEMPMNKQGVVLVKCTVFQSHKFHQTYFSLFIFKARTDTVLFRLFAVTIRAAPPTQCCRTPISTCCTISNIIIRKSTDDSSNTSCPQCCS